jgi:uncharacterized protein YndB with AHSA1/START domain
VPDKRYAFWGPLTPEVPNQEQGQHAILSFDPLKTISFGWHVKDADTTVTFNLSKNDHGTLLQVLHEGVPPWKRGQYTMEDFWTLSLENLRCLLERNTVGGRCDFSVPMRGDVRLSVEINAEPEAVFAAMSDPEQLDRYMSTGAEVEMEVGGRYSFGWQSGGPVKVLDIVPDKVLSYSWSYKHEPDTVVTWELEGSGGKTRLTLVHSGFLPDAEDAGYRIGWTGYMNMLKSMVEGGASWQAPKARSSDYAYAS